MENSVSFKAGLSKDVAVVLSCPGKVEANSTPPQPAMGHTGTNLDDLMGILFQKYPDWGLLREQITIANSWDKVEYKEAGRGRSEATFDEVLTPVNLNRLYRQIRDTTKMILVCGDNAKVAVLALQYAKTFNNTVKFIYLQHIGNVGLNKTIKYDLSGNELIRTNSDKIKAQNRTKRIEVVAREVMKQLQSS
ncbi:hypothetical protein ACJ5M7_005137 [Vibrio harveyi]|uniref:hypothetical protein n=1 Tax=Vibrio owensii TaxID=696485 RepID=UPI0018F1A5FD|nr:hypothetical protein [Vibrio owensii]